MAGFQKIYTSQNEYLYDVGKSTGYFDEEYYQLAKKSGKDFEYLQMMASAKDNISSTFDPVIYNKLSGEERFNYFAVENFMDKSSDDYKQASAYFTQRQKEMQAQEIYDGLNPLEKTINSIGGWVGNALLQFGGIIEGLVDASVELTGALGIISHDKASQVIAKDTTTYNAAQAALNEWINQYTFIDKTFVTKAINDVTSGIARMTPMILGGILAPATGGISAKVGAGIYYASMAGNTAEQAIMANPDIDYGNLLAHTGLSVGLEAVTEWASGKLFGDDIVMSLIKGQKYAPTGSIIKNIAKNFGTEALEESVAELFGSMLYKDLVDPSAEIASIGDIFYAALIGGLTGAVMSGGNVLTTTRKSVVDGKLVDTKLLTKEQRKGATNLGLAQSYAVNNLLTQYQRANQTTDNVTKLMAKYGTSLNEIIAKHDAEYREALAKDQTTKTQQAKAILDLANLMQTIGVEQFTKSANILNDAMNKSQEMMDNYINHTDVYNKKASEAFSAKYKDLSFTPTAQPTKNEQALAKALREIYPGLKVVFGNFGSKNGISVKSMNDTDGWLFIKSGLVEQTGYRSVMQHAIRNELANNVLQELSQMKPEYVNSLLSLIETDKKNYSDLSADEKKTLAQMICFDPINNRRLFLRNNATHSRIFKYLTTQSKRLKDLGRQSEANKTRYHELLVIRDMFLNNIANTIFNNEDVSFVAKEYELTEDEVRTNIANKTTQTTLNDILKVTDISFSKASIMKREAIDELLTNRSDQTTDFDFSRIYDETYYNPVWVAQIKEQQQEQDFEKALRLHIETGLKTTLDDFNDFTNILFDNISPEQFKKLAKVILTQEYLDGNPTEYEMIVTISNKLWTLTNVEIDNTTDSIVITSDQIQGTGKLNIIKGVIDDRTGVLSEKQQGRDSESTGEPVRPVAPSTAKYRGIVTSSAALKMQEETTLDTQQRKMVNDYKKKYNIDLKFFVGDVAYNGRVLNNVNGLVSDNTVYLRYDGSLTESEMNYVLEHEATHRLFAADEEAFKDIKKYIEENAYIDEYQAQYNYYASNEMYGEIYDHDTDRIKEELINDILVGDVVLNYSNPTEAAEKISQFKKDVSKTMSNKIDLGVKFSVKKSDLGYHYGDISYGKKADVREIMPGRSTGHFGTGFYFVSYSSIKGVPVIYLKRGRDTVDFSQYKLFVPKTSSDAFALHEALQAINDASSAKTPNSDFVLDEFNERIKSPAKLESFLLGQGFYQQDVLDIVEDVEAGFNGRAEDKIKKILTEWSESFDALYNSLYKLSQILNVSETKLQHIVMDAITRKTQDSASTLVMKALGYDGIDVRHIPEMDNFSYGSVIYDVKPDTIIKHDKREDYIRFSVSKKPTVANKILQQFEDGSKELSKVQYSESNSKEYTQVSYDMIETMGDVFAEVNNDNYQEVRDALKNSNKPYARQALTIFDLYAVEMVGKFNKDIQQKIENIYQNELTGAGGLLAMQAKRVANRKPISHTIATLKRDGFETTVTDELVQQYDAKLKDKDAYIKELEQQIKDLENKLKQAKNDIDKAAMSKELKDLADKKGVIQNGSNADILDYLVTHVDNWEKATKLKEDMLAKLISTAIVAQEEGKKVGYFMYDDAGKLIPFPKAAEKVAKTLKKLKSFRMWAMLSSPVTWVRNWMGNQGMRGLDVMTNLVEGFMTSKMGFEEGQMKFTETRAGSELYQYIAKQNQAYIMSLVRGEDVKYETSTEKAADIKRRERAIEYESANAFRKACLKAQDMTDWGLSTGPFGDEPVVFQSICKNMGNLVANNIEFLLKGIQVEADSLSKLSTRSSEKQARLDVLNKALKTKNAKDVFNALSKAETERLFDACKERSFQQYFKNPNALSKWYAKFGAKHPVYAELISWVMPFPKVAANVLSMAYRYSPLNFFNGLAELSKYKQMMGKGYKGPTTGFEKAQMIRTFSEASVGTFMLIAGAIFSAMGLIDIDEDDYMGPCIKLGDFKISLSDLAPSMTTFSTAAAVVWAWKNHKLGVTQALNVLYDNTLLGNVENLLTYGSFTDIAKNVSISYLSQYIPAVLKWVNNWLFLGGAKKDKSGNYIVRLIKTLGSYIPGVSALVPDKIDPYTGEKVYQAGASNWFLNLLAISSPLGLKWNTQSELQRHAAALGAETTGLSGKFNINDIDYTVSDKEKYAKYRADYLEETFNNILSGKQKVTVEDENGKRITTTYDKLTDKQKKNVINRLYTEATTMTKIKWWTDLGNKYVVTDTELYIKYKSLFKNIVYDRAWNKSKFVES